MYRVVKRVDDNIELCSNDYAKETGYFLSSKFINPT